MSFRDSVRLIILSYSIGWGILLWRSEQAPYLPAWGWQVLLLTAIIVTVWCALTTTTRAVGAWFGITLGIAVIRSTTYAADGLWRPLGVWALVMSGTFLACATIVMAREA